MELIHGIQQLGDQHRPGVVSIGNFDGVHRGHRQVIQTLLEHAEKLAATPTVITFEPLAREFFMPASVARLTSVEQRAELLFALGVEQVLCIAFDREFAALSPRKFVQEFLVDGLGVCHVTVGDDFRFGKDRAGDFVLLQEIGSRKNFQVSAHPTFSLLGERVSSGRVRDALANSDFALAEQLLGRPYSLSGTISRGQQLGRTIDYPTANIRLWEGKAALNGVFAVSAKVAGRELRGVANIGTRPTVDGKENRLEVHLFDFAEDIYTQTMDVTFHHKIRAEQKFESIELLRKQIEIDAQQARQFFA